VDGGNATYREPGQWGTSRRAKSRPSPLTVDGAIATRVIGEQFGRCGMLDELARFRIADGRLVDVSAPSPTGLQDELLACLDTAPRSRRVGELAIGCNTALDRLIGGSSRTRGSGRPRRVRRSLPRETGADGSCVTHVDVVAEGCTITVDGHRIMEEGRFLV
jgi:leucyl aminopeptidase (aminopeptidase T)